MTANSAFLLSESVIDLAVEGSSFFTEGQRQNSTITLITEASQIFDGDVTTLNLGRASVAINVGMEATTLLTDEDDAVKVSNAHQQLHRKLSDSHNQTTGNADSPTAPLPPVDDPPHSVPQAPASEVTTEQPLEVKALVSVPSTYDAQLPTNDVTSLRSDVMDFRREVSSPQLGYDNVAYSPSTVVKSHKIVRSASNKSSSSSWSSDRMCRICWIGEEKERCVAPCRCAGSYALVHQSCLQRWLAINNRDYCEICRYRFTTNTSIRPICQWNWKLSDNRHVTHLRSTAITLAIVTPILICGIVLCSQKISDLAASPDGVWKSAALMSLVLVSTMTYIVALGYFARKLAIVCSALVDNNRVTIIASITPPPRQPPIDPTSQIAVWTVTSSA